VLSGPLSGVVERLALSDEETLAIFELERAIYELRYELNNRPDWVPIPVTCITRLLERAPA